MGFVWIFFIWIILVTVWIIWKWRRKKDMFISKEEMNRMQMSMGERLERKKRYKK